MEYANIAISRKAIGAVSNSQGGFDINSPETSLKDTLMVSFIGYESYRMVIANIPDRQNMVILLTPVAQELMRVVVSSKPYTVHSLLQEVISRYGENYNTTPVAMESFYRETRQADKKYGYLLEAAMSLFKESYKERYEASLKEVRMNAYSREFDYETSENFLRTLLLNDYIADPFMGFFKRYSKKEAYVIADTTFIDKDPVFVVTLGELPEWKETYWINVNDLAILRFEGLGYYGADSSQVMSKPEQGRVSRYRRLHVVNVYKPHGGKYYPGYLRMVLEMDTYNQRTNKSETYKILDRELMVNRVEPVTGKPADKMERYSLETQLKTYNPEFWKNYTILSRTPLQEQAILDLEKKSKLDDQFSKQQPVVKKN